MGISRVVIPETKHIPISGGDWILIKKRLSAGERHEAFDRMYVRNADGSYVVGPNDKLVTTPARIYLANITAYLLDWSFGQTDPSLVITRQPPEIVEAALHAIDTDSFDEIREAIHAHEAAVAIERAAQKKILDGKPASGPISPLPSVPDSVSMPSAG